jgi:hypothetical protein
MDSTISDKKVKALIHSIGLKYNLRDEEVQKIINSPYQFTRETITELDIPDNITEEEFAALDTNFIYPHIGKFYTKWNLVNRNNKRKEGLTEFNNK